MKKHGEVNIGKDRQHGQRAGGRGKFASTEEFVSVFEGERVGLQRLALSLTADSKAARQCLILAFRECISNSSVFREWVFTWVRRMVIRNAIGLVMGHGEHPSFIASDDADGESIGCVPLESTGRSELSESMVELPEFERFVFVICVLERYSIQDCALLLARSPRDVDEARQRAVTQVGRINAPGDSSTRIKMP